MPYAPKTYMSTTTRSDYLPKEPQSPTFPTHRPGSLLPALHEQTHIVSSTLRAAILTTLASKWARLARFRRNRNS